MRRPFVDYLRYVWRGERRGEGREDRRVEERRGEWLDDHVRQHLLTYLFFCSPSHLICVHILNNWWRCDCTWYVLWHLYLFICLLFVVFCFLFFVFCFLSQSRNYLTCFRDHLNTTRSGTIVRWSKRSERHRAHIYWCLMASLPGSLVAPSPSRTMRSRMLVSLTSISDTLNTYHLLLQPQQFRNLIGDVLNSEDSSPLSARTSAHSSKTGK